MTTTINSVAVLIPGTKDWNRPIALTKHYVTRQLSGPDTAALTFVEPPAFKESQLGPCNVRRPVAEW